MKITDDILNALKEAISHYDSQRAFAKKIDISESSIGKYFRRIITTMEQETWEKVYPEIKQYLKKTEIKTTPSAKSLKGKIIENTDLTTEEKEYILDALNNTQNVNAIKNKILQELKSNDCPGEGKALA